MNLQFVREIPIRIVIEASSERRGFLFYLAAGFYKEMNPFTGMTADLMLVDQWLESLKTDLQQNSFKAAKINSVHNVTPMNILLEDSTNRSSINHALAEITDVARLYLTEKAEKENTVLKSLRFREERGWAFSWHSNQSPEEMIFSHDFYLEFFAPDGSFDLLKVRFDWLRKSNCEADYFQESLRLLKTCQTDVRKNLKNELKSLIGTKLSSGSFLKSVSIHHLGENFTLQL